MKKQYVNDSFKEFVSTLPLLEGLCAQDMEALLRVAHHRDYKKGEYIYRQGEDADRLSIIRSGWVRLYRSNLDGEEGVAQLHTKATVLGEPVILPNSQKNFFSAQAISRAQLINIPGAAVREITRRNPVVLSRMMQGLIRKMDDMYVESEHMTLMSAPQRVACLILRLSAHMVGKGGTFTFPYDKSLAAAQLCMKRETLSRALSGLKTYGVEIQASEITIDNFAQLSAFSCARCSLNTECAGARCSSYPVRGGAESCGLIA